jgi:chromosome segregation ATPase
MEDKAMRENLAEATEPIMNGPAKKKQARKNRRHVVHRCDALEERADSLDSRLIALEAAAMDLVAISERNDREKVAIRDRARAVRNRVEELENRTGDLEGGLTRINCDELPPLISSAAGDLEAIRDLVARVEFLERGVWARIRAAVVGLLK